MNPSTAVRALSASVCLAAGMCASHASADAVNAFFPAPAADRWMYPFNSTPGTRPVISTFGSDFSAPEFDNRDGQMLLRFDTTAQVTAGQGAGNYHVTRAVLTIQVATDQAFVYDDSQDPWQSFLPATDPDVQPDPDAGQPVECFGVGFRNGWTAASFQENTAYAPAGTNVLQQSVRNAYAAGFQGGALVDVSNNVRQRFDPHPWGVGTISTVAPGSLVPAGSLMTFELDVTNADIQGYLAQALDSGRLHLAVTSLTKVEMMAGQFPTFYARENALVPLGLAQAAQLELDVSVGPACQPADLDCSGVVDGTDLGLLLGAWSTSGPGDLDGSGVVDGTDLGLLLGSWG